jgi:hypothetical protein
VADDDGNDHEVDDDEVDDDMMVMMMMWFLSLSTFLVIERARTLASNSRRRCSATTDNKIGAVECRWVIDCDCWCDTDDLWWLRWWRRWG